MKNEQKAREYAEKFFSAQPQGFFKPLDEKTKGMHLILRMLARSGEACAGDISHTLGMSTPRVAAALKALEGTGYVTREPSASDARRVIVRLTDAGRAEHDVRESELLELVDYVLDTVGERDLYELLRIMKEICGALEKRALCGEQTSGER